MWSVRIGSNVTHDKIWSSWENKPLFVAGKNNEFRIILAKTMVTRLSATDY